MYGTKKNSAFSAEMLDQLLDGQDPSTVLRLDGLLGELKKALAERMLNAQMDVHLDGEEENKRVITAMALPVRRCTVKTASRC